MSSRGFRRKEREKRLTLKRGEEEVRIITALLRQGGARDVELCSKQYQEGNR
jgi:hypothetical protein